jgi:UPF0271 protein
VLLNLDAGELETETEALYSHFDILNCACGGHAGDERSMSRVAAFIVLHRSHRVHLGAHPSYPDRDHFGRRTVPLDPQSITDQCRALREVARSHQIEIAYVKLHGALYHDANRDRVLADAVLDAAIAALGVEVTVIGPPRGELIASAHRAGLQFAREGFADRRMRPDGSLVPRSEPNALITDPDLAAGQAKQLASEVDTICLHADTPKVLEIAHAVREALDLD